MVVFNNHGDSTTWHEANTGFAQSKVGHSSSYLDLITILSQVGSDIISYSGNVGYYYENYPDDNWHSYKRVFNSIIKTIFKKPRCMGFAYKGYVVIASNPDRGEILL